MADAIVVTYNSAGSIAACLEALLEGDLHVVVVDNAATADLVRKQFPQVELIANEENVGFARAVNQGLAHCQSDVVMLVNPDSFMPAATASALVAYLRENDDVAVVGPRLREADGSINISAYPVATVGSMLLNRARRFFPFLTPVLARAKRFRSFDTCLHATEATEVDMVCAACVAIRGDFLRDDVGGLDEGYFMYYEDVELCLQARQRGKRVVYLPTVEALHEGGGSSGDRSHVWPLNTRSALRFHAKHRPRTLQLLRLALLGRAVIGLADPRGHRRSAWVNVARVVLTVPKQRLLSEPAPATLHH
ncbi:MAG TPA: glycosyltransferase family 2 protein [Candidatus Dormibacteraeota bacterium]|jgi:GT2 family glycosyltransferase